MKIKVKIHWILEAEAEFEDAPSVSAMGGPSPWQSWSGEQFRSSLRFIEECSKQAQAISGESKTPEP